ncbi:MAG: hypothetical protein ACREBR_01755 [bacterium]
MATDSWWYLACRMKESDGCVPNAHKHHAWVDPLHLKTKSTLMDKENQELLHDCSQVHLAPSKVAQLVSERTGITWGASQIAYLCRKSASLVGNLTANGSSADSLVSFLEKR